MNLIDISRHVLFLTLTITMIDAAETPRDILSSDRMDRLSVQSDVVALVEVVAIDLIRKPTKTVDGELHADVFIYGRLVTLRIVDVYSSRTPGPETVYVFQRGAASIFDQAKFEVAKKYAIFLKACPPPELIIDNVETEPPLPSESYYCVLQENKGSVAKDDTKAFTRIDSYLRAKHRLPSRVDAVPSE